MDPSALRAHFPVLESVAYLNAGTDGPVPREAADAARGELERQRDAGRTMAHFERRFALAAGLRAAYGRVAGAPADQIALTTSTSEGIGRVLAGLDLGPGDEILTSDEEHPGLLGPLAAARDRGVTIRMGPLATLHEHVTAATSLIACSHVGWVSGLLAPPELGRTGVPLVLDGAQGAGAVPLDVAALGCSAYAASGQKWLCGADGTGFLWLDPAFGERVRAIAPSYMSFADTSKGLDSPLREGAARHDAPAIGAETVAFSAASLAVLEAAGLDAVHAHAASQAETLVGLLRAAGRAVAPRDATTLVSWEEGDTEGVRDALTAAGVVVRNLPGTPLLRASVGAWASDGDLDRLVAALP